MTWVWVAALGWTVVGLVALVLRGLDRAIKRAEDYAEEVMSERWLLEPVEDEDGMTP